MSLNYGYKKRWRKGAVEHRDERAPPCQRLERSRGQRKPSVHCVYRREVRCVPCCEFGGPCRDLTTAAATIAAATATSTSHGWFGHIWSPHGANSHYPQVTYTNIHQALLEVSKKQTLCSPPISFCAFPSWQQTEPFANLISGHCAKFQCLIK